MNKMRHDAASLTIFRSVLRFRHIMLFPRRALPLLFLLLTALLLGFISLRLLKASVTPSPSPANFIRSHLGLAPMQCPTVTHKILFWNDLTKARLTYDPVFDVLQDGVITVSDAIVLNTAMLQVMIDCNNSLPPPAVCGNGTQEHNEVCDQGFGKNGLPCLPAYKNFCTYCSADCTEELIVKGGYCGDDILQYGWEQCEKTIACHSGQQCSSCQCVDTPLDGNISLNRQMKKINNLVFQAVTIDGKINGFNPFDDTKNYLIEIKINGNSMHMDKRHISADGRFRYAPQPYDHISVFVSVKEISVGAPTKAMSKYFYYKPTLDNLRLTLSMDDNEKTIYRVTAAVSYYDPKIMKLFVNGVDVTSAKDPPQVLHTPIDDGIGSLAMVFDYEKHHAVFKLGPHPKTLYCCAVGEPIMELKLYEADKLWWSGNAAYHRICGNGIWECPETCETRYDLQPGCTTPCLLMCDIASGTVHMPANACSDTCR